MLQEHSAPKSYLGNYKSAFVRIPILLGIAAVSAGLSLTIFATQEKLAWRDLWHSPAVAPTPPTPISTVGLADALRLFYTPGSVILDVREKRFYDYGHIEGALSVPFESMELLPAPLLEKLKAAPSVLVYCSATSCGTSFLAARKLMDQGLDQTVVYPEGWGEWRSCWLPMTMSRKMQEEEDRKAQAHGALRKDSGSKWGHHGILTADSADLADNFMALSSSAPSVQSAVKKLVSTKYE